MALFGECVTLVSVNIGQVGLAGHITPEKPHRRKAREVVILYTNDLHGHVEPFLEAGRPVKTGGIAYVAGVLKRIRKKCKGKPVFYIDSGDAFQGSILSNWTHGKQMLRFF